MSKMFAVCPDAGRSASVVEPVAPETIESFAYGDDVPSPTRSVEVASVT
jgi:hypothetical protein